MILVEYFSNNSGGSDWLGDKEWSALENAGWKLFGFGDFVYKDGDYDLGIDGLPKRQDESARDDRPRYAFKLFDNISEAIGEFEKLTGEDVSDEGCNCCGAPHSFSWPGGYGSGEDLLQHIYRDVSSTLSKRQLIEQLQDIRGDA